MYTKGMQLQNRNIYFQVFGGGPVLTGNPEPYAAFFDVILMGDGEDLVGSFLDAMKFARGGAGRRSELLQSVSQVRLQIHSAVILNPEFIMVSMILEYCISWGLVWE